jgi:transposase
MTPTEIRNAVCALQAKGHSLREISRILAMSRNTVRRILRAPAGNVAQTPPCDEATLGRLKAAFARARGNVVRVRELLADDGLEVSYSTLTRWVRRPTCVDHRDAPASTASCRARRCSTTPRRTG